MDVIGRGYIEYKGYSFFNDYSEIEFRDIVLDYYGDMMSDEFEWVY